MSNKVYLLENININDIKFSNIITKKKQNLITKDGDKVEKTIHYIDITYKGGPLYIQINHAKLTEIKNDIRNAKFNITEDIILFIKELEEYLIKCVHKNSQKWFGKSFTINKVRSSLISNILQNCNFICTLEKDSLFFNQYKTKVLVEDIIQDINNSGLHGKYILKLANLQFMDNYFTYNFALEQSKVSVPEHLDKYSIIDTNSDISENLKYEGADYNEYYHSE